MRTTGDLSFSLYYRHDVVIIDFNGSATLDGGKGDGAFTTNNGSANAEPLIL